MSAIASTIIIFLVLLFLGLPVAFVLGIVSVLYCLISGEFMFLTLIPTRIFSGMNNFVIMAIPLFILTGELMNKGNVTRHLVGLADLIVGRFRGGLAHVNVIASTLFAGITGSALSDVAVLGSMLIPVMNESGYENEFSTAVTAASAIQGPIIPPSIPAVLIAAVTGTSTGALFLGGAIPGFLMGVGCCIVVAFVAKKRDYPRRQTAYSLREGIQIIKNSLLGMMTPIIILGGILSGIFTPTEAAGVAVLYSFCLSVFVYKSVGLPELILVLKTTIIATSKVYFIVGTATAFAWFLSIESVPNVLAKWIVSVGGQSTSMVLLMINLFLLFWGMWMDTAPSILILAPILFPITAKLGVHPTHFGVIMLVNLMIGLLTPPFGMALFSAVAISGVSLGELLKELWPYLVIDVVILALVTYVPAVSLYLPRLFGLI